MRIFNKFKGTNGFISTWERVIRFRDMITKEAKERARILVFWKKHGTEATTEAFKVKRRTLFLWQSNLKEGQGKLEALNPKTKAPKTKRKRSWDTRLLEEIKRLRIDHPNLGADKLYPLLLDFADMEGIAKTPGSSTIERLIKDPGVKEFVASEISTYLHWLWYALSDVYWMSPLLAIRRADSKISQLKTAPEMKLEKFLPRLVSNGSKIASGSILMIVKILSGF
ncbi:MAG: hypothetical protein UY54_C0013G0002 [Parcubacteria group bacterium GW2011_GWA2_50_10b]|nr:MAG: hypothetical protein UY54_C0013G0002 [Parcubacteria group bacterium GW2011_GWA2_50_10b]